MEYLPGQIVIALFPFDNLQNAKERPALVLAKSWYNSYILAAMTSQEKQLKNGAIEITAEHIQAGLLKKSSYLLPHVLFTASG